MDVRRGKKSPSGGRAFEPFCPGLGGPRTDPERGEIILS